MTHHDDVDARNRPIADDEPIQLLVQPWLRPHLFAFLKAAGLDVGYAPWLTGENDLPVFMTAPAKPGEPRDDRA